MYQEVIFREYDIRGVYGHEFDAHFGYQLGQAYVQYYFEKFGKVPTITVGHDARISKDELKKSVASGVIESGGHVIHLGLITSPISYFSTFEIPGVDGAIMITGSHNPPDYNGFKVSVGKQTIFGEEIQKLKAIMAAGKFQKGKGTIRDHDIFPAYLTRYKKEFGDLSGVKVVLDCGNGAGGCIARKLYEGVGLKPTILFEEPDGRFPNHHPDPTVEKNLTALKAQVKKEGASVGIGFDGDADRIGIVDHNGRMIFGDELMVFVSRAILKTNPGQKIIGDVKCSDRLYADIQQHGGVPIMWKTGHSLIKEKIKIEHAPFGGEMSGHIFFADRNYGYDDALYAGLRICEILKQTGKTIPELMAGLPTAYNTPEIRIDTTEEKKQSIVNKLIQVYGKTPHPDYKVNLIDGIRISYKDGWALARASNTQPVLVVRFESNTAEGLKRIQTEIESIVNPLL